MTVSLSLPPGVEEAYLAEANARGLSLHDLLQEVLLGRQPAVFQELGPEEWVREFKTWTHSHSGDELPVLTEEAMSRDSIYGERGL